MPRYFQVHFEHIHDNTQEVQGKLNQFGPDIHDLQNQLSELSRTIGKVEEKLDRFIVLLGQPTEPEYLL
ncbi:MAG: hypothetical protein PHY16_08785 [Methylobacter sp.]|nr:hypothetical protein [Methylobacter sp.]